MDSNRLVHVVDDSATMRAMTAAVLEGAGLNVRPHAGAVSVLTELGHLEGGCVLTDVRMPRIDGIELLTRLRAAGSTVPVVVMTGHGDVTTAVRAMKLGAMDFIEKPFDPEVLLRAVRVALRCGQANGQGKAHDPGPGVSCEHISRLTARELQVLDYILVGRTHKEIGEELGISPRTVEVFRSRVMAKMECETVQDLVRAALVGGWA